MQIIFLSAFALLVSLLINQFIDSKHHKVLKKIAIFGIIIGLVTLGYDTFLSASTDITSPITIHTENNTNQDLKLYVITFGKDTLSRTNTKVFLDTEIVPRNSSTFSVEGNEISEFWIVAKNKTNDIKYLNVPEQINSEIDIKITDNEAIDAKNAQTARELIFAKDINNQVKNFGIWSNIILIGLLVISIFRMKKNRKNTQITK